MGSKIKVCVLCGGQSAEHEISVLSAGNVVLAIDQAKYEVNVVYLSKQGNWYWLADLSTLTTNSQPRELPIDPQRELLLFPGRVHTPLALRHNSEQRLTVDCFVPVLHGTQGEDGAIQGLLDLLGTPYLGSSVLSSAICMHKHVAKTILRAAGLPTVNWCVFRNHHAENPTYRELQQQWGDILFVKPSALGSSIGIQKVMNSEQFQQALSYAWRYDDTVIVEQGIRGREFEVAVLGNENPTASLPGEIITRHDFYSYTAKYLDPDGAQTIAPAELPVESVRTLQKLAVEAFNALECHGLARVDFFMTALK